MSQQQFTARCIGPLRVLLLLAPLSLAACGRDKEPTLAPEPTPDLGSMPNPAATPPTVSDDAAAPTTADAAAAEASDSHRGIGQTLDDGAITAKVKTKLLADGQVKGMKINVDTKSGEVTLTGQVDNQTQADRAIEIARGTDGVSSVQSQLTIKPRA